MYYVYAGSYRVEANAMEQSYELFKHGYDVIAIKFSDNIRLQVGEFKYKDNALAFIGQLNTSGFSAFYEYYDESGGSVQWELKYLMQN